MSVFSDTRSTPLFLSTNGFVTVDNSTAGTGGVTTMAGASINGGGGGGGLLIASNGTVNIGALNKCRPPTYVVAGVGFTTAPVSNVDTRHLFPATPVPPTALPGGANSVVNFTGPATLDRRSAGCGGRRQQLGHPYHLDGHRPPE